MFQTKTRPSGESPPCSEREYDATTSSGCCGGEGLYSVDGSFSKLSCVISHLTTPVQACNTSSLA
jgi:hypothetical protein